MGQTAAWIPAGYLIESRLHPRLRLFCIFSRSCRAKLTVLLDGKSTLILFKRDATRTCKVYLIALLDGIKLFMYMRDEVLPLHVVVAHVDEDLDAETAMHRCMANDDVFSNPWFGKTLIVTG